MNKDEKVLQEYILYVQHKEQFVNRSFAANRFYLVLTLVILLALVPVKFIPFAFGTIITTLLAVIGMVLCVLWQMNIASYKRLLKIKLQNVIEKLEDELPVKPYQMESLALRENPQKKGFIFGDIQTLLAIIILIAFATIFISDLVLLCSVLTGGLY